MTREEILELIDDLFHMYASDFRNDARVEAESMIDDFESRTCENCIYYTYFNNYAKSCNHPTNYIIRGIPKDFGCNKYEAKDD